MKDGKFLQLITNPNNVETDILNVKIRFDPWQLLNSFKQKAISLGVEYIQGEVCGFDYKMKAGDAVLGPNLVLVKGADGKGRSLEFDHCVIAAGYDSGRVSKLAGIGAGKGILSHPIPVEPK